MAKAKHLKLELGMRLLGLACLLARTIAPVIALFERDWLYGSMLAVPIVFGSLPRRIRPWRREERVRVQFLYAYAVGLIGLGTGHVWLAVAGVFVPNLIILAEGLVHQARATIVRATRRCGPGAITAQPGGLTSTSVGDGLKAPQTTRLSGADDEPRTSDPQLGKLLRGHRRSTANEAQP
jgi:hypothetical protein